jgi:hypothetical protein
MNLNTLVTPPVGIPSPLHEVYDLVADAVAVACGFRQEMAQTECDVENFKAAALALAKARHKANEALRGWEIWLRTNAAGVWEACRAALEAIEPVNHACSHVLPRFGGGAAGHLAWDFRSCPAFGNCNKFTGSIPAYFGTVPAADERGLLERLRSETIAAVARLESLLPVASSTPTRGAGPGPRQDQPPSGNATTPPGDRVEPGLGDAAVQNLGALRLPELRPQQEEAGREQGGLLAERVDAVTAVVRQEKKAPPPPSPDSGTRVAGKSECSVRLIGEVWHLRYCGEAGDYPDKGNKCIAWLAKLLTAPKRSLTVAAIRGDPEGKLAVDAMIGTEREADSGALGVIKKRLEEIDDITGETGGSERLEEERAELLGKLKTATKSLKTPLKGAHHNIATQLRTFLREKLAQDMPQLAAHLKASLKLDFPEFSYYPPDPPPDWQF